jgi:carboxylesterase type B
VFGDAADGVVRTYIERHRDRPLTDVLVAMETDRVFRIPAIRLAEADVRAGRPVHMYLFAWETPAFGGLLRSCHALELPFMWDALDQGGVNVFTGDGPERHGLARDMHERWIAFARTGDPGWPGYDLEQRPVIVFDGSGSRVVNDPAGDERRLWDGTTQEDR